MGGFSGARNAFGSTGIFGGAVNTDSELQKLGLTREQVNSSISKNVTAFTPDLRNAKVSDASGLSISMDPISRMMINMADLDITKEQVWGITGYEPTFQERGEGKYLADFYSKTHLSDLFSGSDKAIRDKEINYYMKAVDKLRPYITKENQDGTYNLLIPQGVDLAPTRHSSPMLNTPDREQAKGVWSGDTRVDNLQMILDGDVSRIYDYLYTNNRSAFAQNKAYWGSVFKENNPSLDTGGVDIEADATKRISKIKAENKKYAQNKEFQRRSGAGVPAGGVSGTDEDQLSTPTLLGR